MTEGPTQHMPPPPSAPPPGYAGGVWMPGARMPIPGNAEFAVYFLIEVIFAIIWISAESVNTHDWVWFSTILTAFYILSRGIAKASRVLEQ